MKQSEVIQIVTHQFKLVRTEFNYTQEEMAHRLGISKKTLVQIEKGRQEANWIQVIALCSLFGESTILQDAFGGDPLEVVKTVAHHNLTWKPKRTLGGKLWWRKTRMEQGFTLQKNLVTGHYRILDEGKRRYFSSFSKEDSIHAFEQLIKNHMNE